MLDAAARRRAWGAMIGATASEGAALWWIFHGDSWPAILHYATTPPGNGLAWFAAAVLTLAYCGYSARGLPEISGITTAPVPVAAIPAIMDRNVLRCRANPLTWNQND